MQCFHRWTKVFNGGTKGPWSAADDARVAELVGQIGAKKWSCIAAQLPGRTGKQCRERWHNHLNPYISKVPWSEHEVGVTVSGKREWFMRLFRDIAFVFGVAVVTMALRQGVVRSVLVIAVGVVLHVVKAGVLRFVSAAFFSRSSDNHRRISPTSTAYRAASLEAPGVFGTSLAGGEPDRC